MWILEVLIFSVSIVFGHHPIFEGEVWSCYRNVINEDDSNFQNPIIYEVGNNTIHSDLFTTVIFYNVLKSIYDCYDVVKFTLTDDQVPTYLPYFYASTYACPIYENYFPSFALLGPLEDPQFTPVMVNFSSVQKNPWISEMPTNFGAIIKHQIKGPRNIYYDPDTETTQYLPYGLSVNCFDTNSCDFNSTLFLTQLTVASDYYMVVWNPDDDCNPKKTHGNDYQIYDTFMIQGVYETPTESEQAITDYFITYGFYNNFKFLKGPKCKFLPATPS